MLILGNIFWVLLGGIFISIFYFLGGCLLCITIVGIPFGIQCFKLALFSLIPFGREVIDEEKPSGVISIIMNVLWLLFCGLEIAVAHLFFALICTVTIIGIPLAKQHIKLIRIAIMPFGKRVVKNKS